MDIFLRLLGQADGGKRAASFDGKLAAHPLLAQN